MTDATEILQSTQAADANAAEAAFNALLQETLHEMRADPLGLKTRDARLFQMNLLQNGGTGTEIPKSYLESGPNEYFYTSWRQPLDVPPDIYLERAIERFIAIPLGIVDLAQKIEWVDLVESTLDKMFELAVKKAQEHIAIIITGVAEGPAFWISIAVDALTPTPTGEYQGPSLREREIINEELKRQNLERLLRGESPWGYNWPILEDHRRNEAQLTNRR